jgi:hypothetical protein
MRHNLTTSKTISRKSKRAEPRPFSDSLAAGIDPDCRQPADTPAGLKKSKVWAKKPMKNMAKICWQW